MPFDTVVLWALVGLAAIWDATQRRIPNALILAGLFLGPALHLGHSGLPGLLFSLSGAAFALGVLLIPFALRGLGGGDVKLVIVCGAFLGWRGVLKLLLVGAVANAVLALIVLLSIRLAALRGRELPEALRKVPTAVAIAAAAVLLTLGVWS